MSEVTDERATLMSWEEFYKMEGVRLGQNKRMNIRTDHNILNLNNRPEPLPAGRRTETTIAIQLSTSNPDNSITVQCKSCGMSEKLTKYSFSEIVNTPLLNSVSKRRLEDWRV